MIEFTGPKSVHAPAIRRFRTAPKIPGAPAYARVMSFPRRCRLGGAVALIALGLLSMHGLAAADAPVESVGHGTHGPAAVATDFPMHGDLGQATESTGGDHDPLHALGQTCLWLMAGGALLFLARSFPQPRMARLPDSSRNRGPIRTPWSTLDRPPDPRLATVALRC